MATAPSVNFLAPGTEAGLDYTQVQRQREMAKALMQSSFNPQGGQMIGNIYVPPGKLSYAAQIAQALAGGLLNRQADDQERTILQKAQQQRAAEAQGFMTALNGTPGKTIAPLTPNDDEGNPMPSAQTQGTAPDRARALAIALQSQNPSLQSMGGELMKQQLADQRRQQILGQFGFGGQPGQAGEPSATPGASAGGFGSNIDPRVIGLVASGDPALEKLGGILQDTNKPIALREGDLVVPDGKGGYRAAYSQPKLPAGMVPERAPNGQVLGAKVLPGFESGNADIAGAERKAQEQAAAKFDMVKIGDKFYTREQAAQLAGEPSTVAPLPGATQPGQFRGSFTGTPESIISGINALPEPDRSQARQAYSNQLVGNNPEFSAMGTGAQPPLPGAGAGRGGQGGPGIPVQSDESKAYGVARAKDFAAQAANYQKAGQQAGSMLRNIDDLRNLYADPNVATGALAEKFSGLKNVAASFGIDMKGLSSEQAAQAITNKMSLELRSPEGGAGMPGSLSDSDREFLRSMTPNLTRTPEGRAQIMNAYEKLAKRQIEVARMAAEYEHQTGQLDAGFDRMIQNFANNNRLFVDPKPATGLPPGWSVKVK